jgi:hypothetical protein
MMMAALEAGGLVACKNKERDDLANLCADEAYHPNKNGLYELSDQDLRQLDFPRPYEGKLLKVLYNYAPRMRVMPGGLKVIIMRRDLEEIRQSYDAFFEAQLPPATLIATHLERLTEAMYNRKDVLSVHEFQYRAVVADPQKCFEQLKEDGWPIDVTKAVSVVDPALCRFKKEALTIGVI